MTNEPIEQKNRELWRGHGLVIGTYEYGYTVYEPRIVQEKDKNGNPNKRAGEEIPIGQTYYPKLIQAVLSAAHRAANKESVTLMEYVDKLENMLQEFGKVADKWREIQKAKGEQ